MTKGSDYVMIDYMYRDAQNSKTFADTPLIFFNPNGYPIKDIQEKLEAFGIYPGEAIIFEWTFTGLIKYQKLTNEDYNCYEADYTGPHHPFTEITEIELPSTLKWSDSDVQSLIEEYVSENKQPIPTIDQLFERLEIDGGVEGAG